MIYVCHTTRYRGGSAEFARAAATMVRELKAAHPGAEVVLEALERKGDFVDAMARIARDGRVIDALHFIGHSGMYGVMFGSTSFPEQFSPHEWRALKIPFGEGARAYFHACRTARWFAPFFARTFGVETFGHHGYTTVSRRPDRFSWAGLHPDGPVYLIACPGKKSHGLGGSLAKYVRRAQAEPMLAFLPGEAPESSYDAVAALYDRAFADIRVRRDEMRWLERHLADLVRRRGKPRVLDIGCGNGAMLRALEGSIASAVGVDRSVNMVASARQRHAGSALRFEAIDGPHLPFPDGSFDLVTSFLSFRYLDWDPMMAEIRRVLAPGGSFFVLDMVEKPAELRDLPALARQGVDRLRRSLQDREFDRDVRTLTQHPAWKKMLEQNPIRAEHEYRWYLESRFPGRKLEVLNVARRARLVAFDSGPLAPGASAPMSFP